MPDNKITVLVIDDSALMRNIITKLIEKDSALKVGGTAMNGRFGLNKLPRINPDVIVLDLEMPEMNGIDFLKELQCQRVMKFLLLSSHPLPQRVPRLPWRPWLWELRTLLQNPAVPAPMNWNQIGNSIGVPS